jgi:4'-phosphopantetheinyl transferase
VATSLPHDDVHVWYRFTEAIAEDEVERLSATILSEDERARARRFVFARDRRDYTVAHALVRRTLSRYDDRPPQAWTFDEPTKGGKPAIAGEPASPLEFNLSHTHGLVACAVARGTAVGVDVESIARVVSDRDIANRFFSPVECADLDAGLADAYSERFIELWTLKESYLKGIGTGLSHPLNDFSFRYRDPRGLTFAAPPDVSTDEWQFALATLGSRYRLAVAVRRSTPGNRCRVVLHDAGGSSQAAILRESVG